jgi:hypothetical protein
MKYKKSDQFKFTAKQKCMIRKVFITYPRVQDIEKKRNRLLKKISRHLPSPIAKRKDTAMVKEVENPRRSPNIATFIMDSNRHSFLPYRSEAMPQVSPAIVLPEI